MQIHSWVHQLSLGVPMMQAPMAGASDAAFVAAASNAGALGSLGAGMMSPEVMCDEIGKIRTLTDRAFAVNLMVLPEAVTGAFDVPLPEWLQAEYAKAGVMPAFGGRAAPSFEAQFEALVASGVPVASFTFGILSVDQVARLHAVGTQVIGTVNHPDEALAWAMVGADAIVVQGAQAGGHRGGWAFEQSEPLPLADLFAQVKAVLQNAGKSLPLIAAGGIATPEMVADYLAKGAAMVSVGTAFLTTHESPINPLYKQRLLMAVGADTALTRLYSGKLARGIITDFMRAHADIDGIAHHPSIPIYPITNAMTKSLRAHAAKTGNTEQMSLWAGEAVQHCQAVSVAQLIAYLSQMV